MKEKIKSYFENLNPKKLNLGSQIRISKIKKLGQGSSNINYLVVANGKKLVFRLNAHPEGEGKLKREYLGLKAIENLGISPKALFFDGSKKKFSNEVLVLKYIEGRKMSLRDLNVNFVKRLARISAKIHRFDISNLKIPFYLRSSGLKEIEDYKKKFRRFLKDRSFFEMYELSLERIRDDFKKLSAKKRLALNHSDIQVGNIITQKNKIKLIDWEFMYKGDPAGEVAYIFTDFGRVFTEKEKRVFYENYLRVSNEFKNDVKIYQRIRFLEGFYWAVWHALKVKKGLMDKEYVKNTSKESHIKFAEKLFKRAVKHGVINKKYSKLNLRRIVR